MFFPPPIPSSPHQPTNTAKMTTTTCSSSSSISYSYQQLGEEDEEEDLFDLLPDPILLEIFNRVHDANSLFNCTSTCKRFASLIPQVNTLHLTLPSPKNPLLPTHKLTTTTTTSSSTINGFINKIVIKPIQSLLHAISPKKSSSNCTQCDNEDVSYVLPNQILKNFNEIQSLRLELPKNGGDISSSGGDALLKWKAEFGNELQSCVMLAANSFDKVEHRMFDSNENPKEEDSSCFTNDALKLRVVWTISCLIAASARHHLLKQILSEHPTIRDAEIRDGSKQGRICMREDQVEELRNGMVDELGGLETMERMKVPALRMKMWYVGELELPESGYVLKGATLVVIRPAEDERSGGDDGGLAMRAFGGEEKWFGEAARKMIKKKKNAFTLEMNSF